MLVCGISLLKSSRNDFCCLVNQDGRAMELILVGRYLLLHCRAT